VRQLSKRRVPLSAGLLSKDQAQLLRDFLVKLDNEVLPQLEVSEDNPYDSIQIFTIYDILDEMITSLTETIEAYFEDEGKDDDEAPTQLKIWDDM